jgi:hypothetical protein
LPLKEWFDFKIPRSTVSPDYIATCLENEALHWPSNNAKVLWLGGMPSAEEIIKRKKGKVWNTMEFTFHHKRESFSLSLELERGKWFYEQLQKLHIKQSKPISYGMLKSDFEAQFDDFELFWYSKPLLKLRDFGLLVV